MNVSQFTLLDWIFIFCIAVPAVMGLFKGFVRMLFGLAGTVAGITLSIVFAPPLGDALASMLDLSLQPLGRFMAFLAIFLACWITGLILGFFSKKFLKIVKLGWADRVLGGALGGVKGGVLVVVICIICSVTPGLQPAMRRSRLGVPILRGVIIVADLIPDSWVRYFDPDRWIGRLK